MNSISYYTSADSGGAFPLGLNKCSIESLERPLIVNCAGNFKTSFPLTTDNTRKDYYLMYIVSGSLEMLLGERTVKASAGNIIIFPPHQRYKYSYFSGEALDYMWVHFTGSYAERFLSECKLSPLPYFGETGNDQRIASKFKKLFECFEAGDHLQKYDLSVYFEQIILSVSRAVCSPSVNKSLERSLRYIHTEYSKKYRYQSLRLWRI